LAGKYNRVNVGSVIKNKDKEQLDYIKINPKAKEALINALQNMGEGGLYLNLESKESQLAGIELAVENNKLSPENAAKARERVEQMPDFVRFQIVLVQK
jgi:hypothetical protein